MKYRDFSRFPNGNTQEIDMSHGSGRAPSCSSVSITRRHHFRHFRHRKKLAAILVRIAVVATVWLYRLPSGIYPGG